MIILIVIVRVTECIVANLDSNLHGQTYDIKLKF